MTKTSLEENRSGERTVAVITQESLDGIREKVMRVASFDEVEESSGAGRRSSSEGAETDRNKKANEIVRDLVGLVLKEVTLSLRV